MNDLPIFLFPTTLHVMDIILTIAGGFTEILWIVVLASVVQSGFLWFYWSRSRKITA
jgi:hypothetical protein